MFVFINSSDFYNKVYQFVQPGEKWKMKQNKSKTLCIKSLQTAFEKLVSQEDKKKSEQNQISDN